MQKKITTEEFLKKLTEFARYVNENKREIDSEGREILDLAVLNDKIYPLYMQKMADMNRKELQELIDETNRVIARTIFEEVFDEYGTKTEKLEKNDKNETYKRLIDDELDFTLHKRVLEKIFKTILEIKPELYPLHVGSELVNSQLTLILKSFIRTDEDQNFEEYERVILNFDILSFLPLVAENKTLKKEFENLQHYYGIKFSKPFNYIPIKILFIAEQILDYISYKYPEVILKNLLFRDEEGVNLDIQKFKKFYNLIVDTYINIALNRKKKALTPSKFSKLIPKIRKYLQENLDILEKTADILFDENIISIYAINKLEDLDISKEAEELINKNLLKEIQQYGLERLKSEIDDYLLRYSTDDILKILSVLLAVALEKELDVDLENITDIFISIFYLPYVSKDYDYEILDKAYETLKIYYKDEEISKYITLYHHYLKEEYKQFLEEYEKSKDIDDGIYVKLPVLMAKYYIGKIEKEQLIKQIKDLEIYKTDRWKEMVNLILLSLEEKEEKLKKFLEDADIEDILNAIFIYPYEPKFYEALELEYEYEPKTLEK